MGIWVNEYSFSDYTVLYALIVSKKSCRHIPIRVFVCILRSRVRIQIVPSMFYS